MPRAKVKKRDKKISPDVYDHVEGTYKGELVRGKRHGRGHCKYMNGGTVFTLNCYLTF
jgi:hypothetical protein